MEKDKIIEQLEPAIEGDSRQLSTLEPFAFSRPVLEARKCVLNLDEMWLVETKGQESLEVAFEDRAAQMWCENATTLTGEQWRYVKVPQKEYQKLQPVEFSDLLTFVE